MRVERTGVAGTIRSDINVTPLVDVCLVLLIIFMVVGPLMTLGPDLALPFAPDPEPVPVDQRALVISLESGGRPVLSSGNWQRSISASDLPSELARAHSIAPDRRILIRADRRLDYGAVKEILRAVASSGFGKAGLIAKKEE